MTDKINEIINDINDAYLKNSNANIYLYPNCNFTDENKIIIPCNTKNNKLNILKKNVIIETYYRDLIKIEIRDEQNEDIIINKFAKKQTFGKKYENMMLIINNYTEISNDMFPNTIGHHLCTKKIITYDTNYTYFNILLVDGILLIEIKNNIQMKEVKDFQKELISIIEKYF